MMNWTVDACTTVLSKTPLPRSVRWAIGFLERDIRTVFGKEALEGSSQTVISVSVLPGAQRESWVWRFPEGDPKLLEIVGTDELGAVFGVLEFSRRILGVSPLWFWNDERPQRKKSATLLRRLTVSEPFRVRNRGWFVNDEVCLLGISASYPPEPEIWEKVFEALLRLGGNTVIPGTDLPRSGGHWELASDMGLWLTNHHAEPLGAELFSRAHPDVSARYDQHAGLFEKLWEEAVVRNKDRNVLWVLGFRGQGDVPFWSQDPRYETSGARGGLISQVIARQHEILTRYVPDARTCAYIYGELTDLYVDGHIRLPEGTIRVWSDNGYGKMVSRRQENENRRQPSLPTPEDEGPHGIYYHVTFHDLQASNHLTQFPCPPELLTSELEKAFTAGADRFLLVNCGNIRPHVPFLELTAQLWHHGKADTDLFLRSFAHRVYPPAEQQVVSFFKLWPNAMVKYGPNEDDRAGEEFHHHVARMLVQNWITHRGDRTASNLLWLTGERSFENQVRQILEMLLKVCVPMRGLQQLEDSILNRIKGQQKRRWELIMSPQVSLQADGCTGLLYLCQGLLEAMGGRVLEAYVWLSRSLAAYRHTLDSLAAVQTGVWKGFYRLDYLTNARLTEYSVQGCRSVIRQLGDAPNFYHWSRSYLIPKSERGALLENMTRRVLSDEELAEKLEALIAEENTSSPGQQDSPINALRFASET